ncbi:MAG TPA: hypothetical protein VGZ90_12960 [Puia sp.]|jgi:hypothetical protein|nr:hypothetical protein [Puia sp.]
MENIKTTIVLDEGEILNYNLSSNDPGAISIVQGVDTVLRPTIQQNKLSGKIILTILNDRVHIAYENIIPVEFTPVLMDLITAFGESRSFADTVLP